MIVLVIKPQWSWEWRGMSHTESCMTALSQLSPVHTSIIYSPLKASTAGYCGCFFLVALIIHFVFWHSQSQVSNRTHINSWKAQVDYTSYHTHNTVCVLFQPVRSTKRIPLCLLLMVNGLYLLYTSLFFSAL